MTPTPDFFCSDLSQDANEEMAGTAVHVDTWFLLEYAGPWREKATTDNDLPADVQQWLTALPALVENGRVQLIKQPASGSNMTVRFFVAVVNTPAPRLYEFSVGAYEALFDIDIPALIRGDAAYSDHLRPDPLYLVCTNGKRDRCCALHGIAVADALATTAGDAVWQTTHLGGHRFAATLVTLPDGICYGRLTTNDAATLLAHHQRGELWLEKMRGRATSDAVAQLAEVLLRRQTGQLSQDAYRHHKTTTTDIGWQVSFTNPAQQTSSVTLTAAPPLELTASCGSSKRKTIPQYTLVAIHTPAV